MTCSHRFRVCDLRFISLVAMLALACRPEVEECDDTGQEDSLDMRVDFPPPENGVQFVMPDLVLGPYEEKMYCYYDVFEGPTSGILGMLPMYSRYYGHHVFLKGVDEQDETPAGSLVDCTEGETDNMSESTFIQAVHNDFPQGDGNWLNLLPGYAFRLEQGQRVKLDVHFINPTDQTLLINAAVNLELTPEDQVDVWVGGFDLNLVEFSLPPAQETSISFDCELPEGSAVLSLGGHMHENGARYLVEHVSGDSVRPILELNEWDESYRYSPPLRMYWPWEVVMEAGDVIRTTCSWLNLGEQPLSFPDEMCTTFGVATGLNSGFLCEDGVVTDDGQ